MAAALLTTGAFSGRPERDWFVVRTKPRHERIAVRHLESRGVEPYCPFLLQPPKHRHAPRGPVPLFPGYIFVAENPRIGLDPVRYCPGVLTLLTFNREPATVEQPLIDELRRQEGERGFILPEDVRFRIDQGARVRVVGGPMQGSEGVLQHYLKGGLRALLLLDFLRNRHRVELDATAFVPA